MSGRDLAPPEVALPMFSGERPGTRMKEFQLLNWGTFDGAVTRFDMHGANALLTGQVGSGKSTIVDGLTVLFTAPSRVVLNRAAGAERSERTLTSYLLGHYRKVYDENVGTPRADALRDPKTAFAVLVAHFATDGGEVFSAGMVAYMESSGRPHRLYFTAPTRIDIADHLVGHRDARAVRTHLRSLGAETFDENFKSYQRSLCRALKLSPSALDLLVQTVSMKSVGDLTAFVREHMLDAADPAEQIKAILAHWADLNRSYEMVVTARDQLDKLRPVAEHAAAYDRAAERISAFEQASGAVPRMVEQRRVGLLDEAIAALDAELPSLQAKVTRLGDEHQLASSALTQLSAAVTAGGGAELTGAEHDVDKAKADLQAASEALTELTSLARRAGIASLDGMGDWQRFSVAVATETAGLESYRERAGDAEYQARATFEDARRKLAALQEELAGSRASNMPVDDARLRGLIAAELVLEPSDLPFAAELIAVADGSADWEAAAERLVGPFGRSMLVAEEHYQAVARWVDAHHLGRRLVYFRVPAGAGTPTTARRNTMAARLQVRPATRFSSWVAAEVARRFDHVCVEASDELGDHGRAVTRAGQIKDGNRHEKDDRGRADDRLHYILGWDTSARRAWLAEQAIPAAQAAIGDLGEQLAKVQRGRSALEGRASALEQLSGRFTDPARVDVGAAQGRLRAAEDVRDTIAKRPELSKLIEQRDAKEAQARRLLDELGKAQRELGDSEGKKGRWEARRASAVQGLETTAVEPLDAAAAAALDEAVGAVDAPTDSEGCDAWGRKVTEAIASRRASSANTLERASQRLTGAMKDFSVIWPGPVIEFGTVPEARREWLELRDRLETDDLPSYESEFRNQLRTNAIHELVSFNHWLTTASNRIGERIATINSALADIDYRPSTYIRLEVEATLDVEVREFRSRLRDVTSNALLADDEAYAEERFLKVRDLLERFEGRAESASADQAWTRRVTDVRNWHTFAASERTRDEDVAVEHYTDSGGKSGGQKEKLAYTVLAASLSYQYGLAGGHADSFRFVMIDEAFGRGSDESTRFALELFGRLGLQLLVVTPLQKVTTIDPFVEAVGFVSSDSEQRSRLVALTVSEYRESRLAHLNERRSRSVEGHSGPDAETGPADCGVAVSG
ncbi:MAG TPA: SbcC/MukB-like Walker B domain-containing protein [Propionibacteriaceae bacterium]|nr:SbcC/MukB-like Walker B domain-containing protein [Propionibacteriaceae bacterium]